MAFYLLARKKSRSLSLPGKNPSMDFFRDCRIASQFCMRKAALPGLLLFGKEEKTTFPELVEGNISKPNPSPKTQAVTLSLTQGLS
ncbi:MAG: hypothetical protein IKQ13_13430 [Treponema sp.]|nr:hypothetical protein [Treponema sp.]